MHRRAHLAESRQQRDRVVQPEAGPQHEPHRRQDHQQPYPSGPPCARYRQGQQQNAGVEVILRHVARSLVLTRCRAQSVGHHQRIQRTEFQRAFRLPGVVGARADRLRRQLKTRQHRHGGYSCGQHAADQQGRQRRLPTRPVLHDARGGEQCERGEGVQRGLEMPSEDQQPARQSGQRAVPTFEEIQQPRRQRRRLKDAHVRAVCREEPRKAIGERPGQRGFRRRHKPANQQECAEYRQQRMQGQFRLDRLRPRPHQHERPVQRVECPHLRVGQKREPREDVRRPLRQPPVQNRVGEVLLAGVVDVHRVPLNRRVGREQRRRVQHQRRQCGREPPVSRLHRGASGTLPGRT